MPATNLRPSAAFYAGYGDRMLAGIERDPCPRFWETRRMVARLFISPRTAQIGLPHAYTKLGLTWRVQRVQRAARLR